ncbi:MAG: hypothetical protein ACHQIL_09935 [Steroidobacterales bacterium]
MVVATLLLLCVLTWALSHPYRGLFHDAGLYTLQAMAHLHPGTLAHDVFLRFGSQDALTIFSPVYGAAIELLGVEPAAAVLTLCFQLAVFAAAWLLASSVMPGRMALLGVAVLVAVPGYYGAFRVFTCVEPFLTPRMLAEALVLAGLAAMLRERRLLALALIVLASLVHPIIAAAGVAALLCFYVALPYPRAAVASAVIALGVAAVALPRMDAVWLQLVSDRSPYLFLRNWQLEDWTRCGVVLATLIAGIDAAIDPRVRQLCRAALITMLGGLALTWVACDELHLVLAIQLQPWRCQWLGTAVSTVLLPTIVVRSWQSGLPGRTRSALLLAAWLFASNEFALQVLVLLGVTSAGVGRLAPARARWVFHAACLLLAVAAAWRLASDLQFTEAYYLEPRVPLWVRRAMSLVHDGSVPAAIAAGVAWLGTVRCARFAWIVLVVLAGAVCVSLAPVTWQAWSIREFSAQRVAQYAPLRAALPADAEVLLPESPLATWLLLDRPSYLSVIQTSGLVFSRAAAIEFQRRAAALNAAVPAQVFMGWNTGGTILNPTSAQLQRICASGAVEFLVTGADLGLPALAAVQRDAGPARATMRLYRCMSRARVG